MRKPRIMLTGGGTGGHIFPLVAVARALKAKEANVAFIGPEEFSLNVLRNEGIEVHTIIQAGKLRRYFSLKTFGQIIKMPWALTQSLFYLRSFKPDIILGKGGYGSLAPVIAAKILKVPVALHESDILPGMANKFLSRFAGQIFISFKETEKYFPKKETILAGNPIRLKFFDKDKKQAKKILGLEVRRQVIFIIGGSQGAMSLNKLIEKIAPQLLKKYALIISTGKENLKLFKDVGEQKVMLVKQFLNEEELAAAYTLSDIVISRAGGSIFEIAAFAKPSILIPLVSSARGHQLKNAQAYEEAKATLLLEEQKINEQILLYSIESILQNETTKTFMISAAKKFARPKAAEKIAQILLDKATNKIWSKIVQ